MNSTIRLFCWMALSLLASASLVGCSAEAQAGPPGAASASSAVPVATLKELMDSTVDPAADGLWDAVAITSTSKGIDRHQPHTQQEWAAVRRHAITLIEAMNLVVMRGRHAAPAGTQPGLGELPPREIELQIERQRAAFDAFANVVRASATQALAAIDRKNPEALLTAGSDIDAACEACHVTFWYPTTAAAVPPDISGTWSRNPDPKASSSSVDSQPPPLKASYAHAYKAPRPESHPAGAPPKCTYEGMPAIMAARGPLEILQTPGQVTVLAEYMTQTRRIYLDDSLPAPDDINPGYMGYSVAKWHGNTLEIQTVGIREDVRYLDIPHSAKMKISEKIHLTAPELLQDDITIVDPDTLTAPYRLTFTYKKDPAHRITEYACDHAP